MSTYELVVIHSPLLSDVQHREQLERLKGVITLNGGSIRQEDIWGKRRLAYMINKQREGVYSLVQFDAPSRGICLAELDRFCKLEESVLRHMVTCAVLNKSLGTPPRPYGERASRSAEAAAPEATAVVEAPADAAGAAPPNSNPPSTNPESQASTQSGS